MIHIIKSHNELNGAVFAVVEFGLMALFLIPFGVYCLLAQKLAVGLVVGGIGLNCLPVVYYGLRASTKTESSPGTIWNGAARDRLLAENPHMLRDTFTLTGATLVPFLVLIVVWVEASRAANTG